MMKRLKNQDGSTILWAMLLIVILTILLTSILTLSLSYYNSTLSSVKKQQAYFTARSAANSISTSFSVQSSTGLTPSLMPTNIGDAYAVKIKDFGFPSEMGTASAVLTKVSDDRINAVVTAKYRDSKYVMNLAIVKQSIYFGGIGFKTLMNGPSNTSNYSLNFGDKTDVYIDSPFSGNINVGGNLVVNGDINFGSNSHVNNQDVSGMVFDKDSNNNNPLAKIWSTSKYIISNQDLKVTFPQYNSLNLSSLWHDIITFTPPYVVCNDDDYNDPYNLCFLNLSQVCSSLDSTAPRTIELLQGIPLGLSPRGRLVSYAKYYNVDSIQFSNYGSNTDKIVPTTYFQVDDNLKLGIEYGTQEGAPLSLNNPNSSYLKIYLGQNATLQLGKFASQLNRLNFYMDIYGSPGSKVIVNDNVNFYGSINNIDTLQILGNNIHFNYDTPSGTQMEKQKIRDLWQVASYDQGS